MGEITIKTILDEMKDKERYEQCKETLILLRNKPNETNQK